MLSNPPLSLSNQLTLRCLELGIPSEDFRLLVLWACPDQCNIPTQDLLKLEVLAFRELMSCIPTHSTAKVSLAIRFELIAYLVLLKSQNQLALTKHLGSNPATKERLITGLGNYPILPCSLSIRARESSSSIDYELPTAPQKQISLPLHLPSAMLSEKLSNLRLKIKASQR